MAIQKLFIEKIHTEWKKLGNSRPGSEPNVIKRKENFPTAGEAYVIGEQMGRYFFSWGSIFPFVNELPEENVMSQKSGIQWFDSKEEALDAAKTREMFDNLFNR